MNSNNQSSDRKARLWAILATLAFHALLILALLSVGLTYIAGRDQQRTWPPVDESEILFGGEYVMIGEDPAATETEPSPAPESGEEAPQAEGTDLADNGQPVPASQELLASTQPSPVTVKQKPQPKPGPTKEELERAERERVRQQAEREASERVKRRVNFGNGTDGTSSAKAGSPNGNAASGALSGAPGTDLHGRTLASWKKPSGTATGTIRIRVSVNRKGKVTAATYVSGTGAIASDVAARRSCEQAALQSSFSVADNAPVTQTGHITYRFE